MKSIKYLCLFFLIISFLSCDCVSFVKGTVIDFKTREPITKVKIKESKKEKFIYTDSLGQFEFFRKKASLFGCSKYNLSFEKEGYKVFSIKVKSYSTQKDTIILETE